MRTDRCPKGRSVRIFASAYFGSGGGVGYAGAAAYGVTSTRKREKSSEEAAFEDLESYGATVYMGAPVIQADLGGKGGGLSYWIIILDDDYEYNEDGINALRHEYGHWIHFNRIGPADYFTKVGIPSLIGAGLYYQDNSIPYDSLPWEYVANIYGKVYNAEYTSWADVLGKIYWAWTVMLI